MRFCLTIFVFFFTIQTFSQEIPDFTAVDSLYREDQFYVGMTYNLLGNRPSGVSQTKFTPSFSLGFLRDMPINKSRTIAIAAGLGYALNNYNQNILITNTNGTSAYSTIDAGINYDKNKLTLHFIELPIEFRWRNSTPESHIFWRIYSGFKGSYLLYDRSVYEEGSKTILVTKNKDLNPFQYGAYISMGRNTWNLYAYYGLNTIFNKAKLGTNAIEMNTMNFGLMFYIL